jgi:hypothetical protein
MQGYHAPARSEQRTRRKPAHGVARLTLFINGTPYNVRPLPIAGTAALALFQLRKSDGARYIVASTENGVECDCPDHIFNRAGLDPAGCKHVKSLVAVGLIGRKGGV